MIKKNILMIASSALPYHIDKLVSLEGKAKMLTIASYQKPYIEMQKSQIATHKDLEILFKNKAIGDLPKISKKLKVFFSLIQRKEKIILIGIGGEIRPYDLEIFLSVIILRLLRKKVYIMFDTNYQDRPRKLFVEIVKTFLFLPYSGAICSGPSSASYIKFLGLKKRPVVNFGFNTSDLRRYGYKDESNKTESKNNLLFIGRMSNKKNISFLIDVYKEYKDKLGDKALPLRLIGEGPNLQEFKEKVKNAKIEGVYFLGVKNDGEIGYELSNARALLIPSFYEEWGFVVNEAIALSVPVLVSEHVRAREVLVKQFVNGLILEPNNHTGWLESLIMISENQELYKKLSSPNEDLIQLADISSFKKGIKILIGDNSFKH